MLGRHALDEALLQPALPPRHHDEQGPPVAGRLQLGGVVVPVGDAVAAVVVVADGRGNRQGSHLGKEQDSGQYIKRVVKVIERRESSAFKTKKTF